MSAGMFLSHRVFVGRLSSCLKSESYRSWNKVGSGTWWSQGVVPRLRSERRLKVWVRKKMCRLWSVLWQSTCDGAVFLLLLLLLLPFAVF